MNYVNTHKPTNRTLAVIDGGLNLKASVEPLITTQKPRLLDQVRQAIRIRHYSSRTEKAYDTGASFPSSRQTTPG